MANYLGRREKGVKKIREKGDENLGDMGPLYRRKKTDNRWLAETLIDMYRSKGASRIYGRGTRRFLGGDHFFLTADQGGTKKFFGLWPGGDQEKISPPRRGGPGFFCITHDKYFPQKHLFCMF